MLQINYQNQTHYEMDEYVEVFKKIAKYTLKRFNMKGNIELSVTLVSKNTIKEINSQYSHIDRVTESSILPFILNFFNVCLAIFLNTSTYSSIS